jgi:rhamnulokinase
MSENYLACDLGAESGRVILGALDGGAMKLEEVYRFPNAPARVNGSLHWQFTRLLDEVQTGLRKAAETGMPFRSISTDSWGVDYVLFDGEGCVMEPVFHYRDGRTAAGVERALRKITWPEVFEETGIQFMPINTVFQLASEEKERLQRAAFLLGVGDAVNYFLSDNGSKTPRIEASMASTFQLYNPRAGGWSEKLIRALDFPRSIFPEIVPSATRLGNARKDLGLASEPVEIIATCSHDTGAAVAGVPARTGSSDWAYLSSGTWSLMGVEVSEPVISDRARELNFTNEIGCGNSVRLLKNLSGLWLVQECRRAWASEGLEFDYAALTEQARHAEPFRSLIDPSAPEFLAPSSMPLQISEFCRRTDQPIPRNPGEFVRCALESLALLYRRTLGELRSLTDRKMEVLHIVGGGSKNDFLNQLAADSLEIPVAAGPAEATAMGNILLQAMALGHVSSLEKGREVIRNSCEPRIFTPHPSPSSDSAFRKFDQFSRANSLKPGAPQKSPALS